MKKYILMVVTLVSLLVLAGCNDKETYTYSSKEDIQVEAYSVDKLARITIADTYKKNDVTYYVIQTDVSGDREWTLTEAEYDEIIGLGNDAIDCTVHYLKCNSKIISQSYHSLWGSVLDIELSKVLSEFDVKYHTFPSTGIKSIYDMKFNSGEYYIDTTQTAEEELVKSKLTLKRYSFVGESAFTEEEIDAYVEFMHKINSETVKRLLDM